MIQIIFILLMKLGHELFVIDEANPSGYYTTLSANTEIYLISANTQVNSNFYNNSTTFNSNDLIWSTDFPGDISGDYTGEIFNDVILTRRYSRMVLLSNI